MPRELTPYATLKEVKALAGIPEDDTDQDALIHALLLTATDYLERRTGRWFVGARLAVVHDWQESRRLKLHHDLLSVTSVVNGDGTTMSNANFLYYPLGGPPYGSILLVRTAAESFTYTNGPEQAITVTGLWGYSEVPPALIVTACETLVVQALNELRDAGLASVNTDFARRSFDRADHPIVSRAVSAFRRVRIG